MNFLENTEHLTDFAYALVYISIAIVIFIVGKWFYQLLNPSINMKEELVIKDNFAFSFAIVGYYISLIIIMGSAIVGDSKGLINDILDIVIYSTLGIVLLNISSWFSNKIIMSEFNMKKEIIEDQNIGTGVIEGVVFISTSLILFGAITGDSDGYLSGITSSVSYWIAGMFIVFISTKLYAQFVGYDIHGEIEKDNIAAGISFSGVILAISIIVMNALLGDFKDWKTTSFEIFSQVIFGLIILPIIRIIADKILLPGQKLTDEIVNQERPNIGAALIEAFAYVGLSILIVWSL